MRRIIRPVLAEAKPRVAYPVNAPMEVHGNAVGIRGFDRQSWKHLRVVTCVAKFLVANLFDSPSDPAIVSHV
ncbi:hypothetical protein Rcae01_06125 [Novipirellula caenicola]|uniref:Uncharacterized protein n=1 Tax=Novipirellula caenicola TaxID=1536901 RepID=A0ABP9VZQ4_9BACT